MSGQAGGRYTRSASGMVGAMVVVLVVVVAFVLFRDAVRSDVDTTVREVDYVGPAAFAQEQAGFEILAPPRLPEGWASTSVRYTPGVDERWHLGMLTEGGRYVGVEQARSSAENLVEEHVDEEARRGRPVTVAGERWTTWTDDGGDLALVREGDDVTTLVVGHEVPLEVLVELTASLR
ncbi:MAG: DUF4245 domain-containing protein [Actinomycetes bacterium]